MTDLERFIELYRSFGIECRVFVNKDCNQEIDLNGSNLSNAQTDSIKFDGYAGFFSSVEFDMSGKFLKQGFWE